jgi:hypothetical protein
MSDWTRAQQDEEIGQNLLQKAYALSREPVAYVNDPDEHARRAAALTTLIAGAVGYGSPHYGPLAEVARLHAETAQALAAASMERAAHS